MAPVKVYEEDNLALKWNFERIFENIDVVLISVNYEEKVVIPSTLFLYYGFVEEAYINTFEEYVTPMNLYYILKSLRR